MDEKIPHIQYRYRITINLSLDIEVDAQPKHNSFGRRVISKQFLFSRPSLSLKIIIMQKFVCKKRPLSNFGVFGFVSRKTLATLVRLIFFRSC